MGGGFEVPVAETQRHAAPDVGAATGHAEAAQPVERFVRGRGVGFFDVVDEPVLGIFVANVHHLRLNGASFADNFRGEVAILQFESWSMLAEIRAGLRAPGFKKSNLQPRLGQTLARPASGSA